MEYKLPLIKLLWKIDIIFRFLDFPSTREISNESCVVFRACLKAVRYQNCREDYSFLIALLSKFISSPVSLGIVISIGVGTTVVCAVIGFLVAKCYLNWRRQYRKQKKISASLNGTVQKLVISSQPVDFVPLLIQDQLEAEDGEIDNTQYVSLRGRSTESLLESGKDSKEENFPPPFKGLDTASSILDKSDRKLKKPMEIGTRGESLYFDGSGNSEDETEKSTPKKKLSSSVVPPFSQRSLSMHSRPGNQRTAETLRFARCDQMQGF
ncbi:uncharacterized protein [Montipora capricornis]|uniref:uncharacterized protein n=1 Tax=Montipora foliosa TaxID=591990 RepID=UPI0035F1BEC7